MVTRDNTGHAWLCLSPPVFVPGYLTPSVCRSSDTNEMIIIWHWEEKKCIKHKGKMFNLQIMLNFFCSSLLFVSPGAQKDPFSSFISLLIFAARPCSLKPDGSSPSSWLIAAVSCVVKLAPRLWSAFLHRRFWFKHWRFWGSLHVRCRPSSSLLCLLNSKTLRPQTDVGSVWGSSLPPERNPFHEE